MNNVSLILEPIRGPTKLGGKLMPNCDSYLTLNILFEITPDFQAGRNATSFALDTVTLVAVCLLWSTWTLLSSLRERQE